MCRYFRKVLLGIVFLSCAQAMFAQCSAVTSDGTATANRVSKFTTDCNIEPSAITETGGKVGIGTTTPAATLDVKGTATVRGTLQLPALGTATATKSYTSQPFDVLSSAFDSATGKAVSQHLRWQAESFEEVNSGTTSLVGSINLLYGSGSATPAETGLFFTSTGQIFGTYLSTTNSSGTGVFFADSSGNVETTGDFMICGTLKTCNTNTVLRADNAGNLTITGTLAKGAGSFKIDHPLNPANKYLYHSFVESPDMMDVYNGNVRTNKHGLATIVLPDYFEALNKDFRYQLTVIGEFAQAIVSAEIRNNRFTIRTNMPSVKVSWQVTGIRQDAYANAHRISVEEDKPELERGHYLHPELFGEPASKGITARNSTQGQMDQAVAQK